MMLYRKVLGLFVLRLNRSMELRAQLSLIGTQTSESVYQQRSCYSICVQLLREVCNGYIEKVLQSLR